MTDPNQQFVFDARELWASQGVPYSEPDKIEALTVRHAPCFARRLCAWIPH